MSPAHPERVVRALQALVRIPTVSYTDRDRIDTGAFDAMVAELEQQFPLLHANLELTRVADHGLLFHWRGASDDKPVVLMAHTDVVPIDPDATWQHGPFSGDIADGFLWGRGTLDDKGCVVGICEAVERLLEADLMPAQDVWLSFGADEEVMGTNAVAAVEVLRERGVTPWMVLDEGGAIAGGAFPGVAAPMGVVGVTEKGISAIELVAEGRGGHASMPAPDGPTFRLARAITRLDKVPMPANVPAPTLELMRRTAPHLPAALRPLMTNATRVGPLVARILGAAGAEAGAMARTTIATTTLSGSPANNVIASTAKAGLNVRIQVGDTLADVVDHIRRVVKDDSIRIDVIDAQEPSPISPMGDAFALIESSIAAVFPDAVPTPYALMGATDSRHFTALTPNVYRFAPFRMSKAQREAIHSFDERIGVDDLVDGAAWYQHLIERLPQ